MSETFKGIKFSIKPYLQDAILYFCGQELSHESATPSEAQAAIDTVAEWLSAVSGDVMREHYINEIHKHHKKLIGRKTNLTNAIKTIETKRKTDQNSEQIADVEALGAKIPDGVNMYEVMQNGGWYQIEGDPKHKTGIYFVKGPDREPEHVSNFTIKPLFHKVDRDDNSRVVEINDGFTGKQIIEMPSSALLSRDTFRKFLFDKGAYFFEGSGQQLDKINRRIMNDFPKAWELKELGWQPEGFFAYYNYSFNGKLAEYNDAGLVEHNNQCFYSPAVSQAFSDERQVNDMFENDRYLVFKEPPITFNEWIELIHQVYPDHSQAIVGGALLALFRDVHFRIDNNCPHLYFFGESGSGKSKAAESLSNIFFHELPAYALSSGTDFAFAKRLGRYRNTPVIMNEFDDTMIKEERFNQLKNAYDGEGREKGTGMSKNKTQTEKVESLLILVGQFLVTKDDNSIVNRSIVQKFTKIKSRDEKQLAQYERLKDLEKQGLGGLITELMPYRKEIQKTYTTEFHAIMHRLARKIREDGNEFHERILRNYTAIPAFIALFSAHFDFPWSRDELEQWTINQVLNLSGMVNKSDVLMKFWKVLEYLAMEGQIRFGRHWDREDLTSLRLADGTTLHLGTTKPVMMIRLSSAHQAYMKHCRTTGERPIDIVSLENYLKDKDYLLGKRQHRFKEYRANMNADGSKSFQETNTKAWCIDLVAAGLDDSAFNREMGMDAAELHTDQGDDTGLGAPETAEKDTKKPKENQEDLFF